MINVFDDDFETVNITGIEVFATGTHNGKEFDESDLSQIVNNFRKLKSEIEPPIKAGHSNDLAVKDGMPALGWVSDIRKSGRKIVADFKNVPKKVAEMIKNRAFKRVSIELLPQFNDSSGNEFENVLSGVALLGADMPAVKTLDDIPDLFDNSSENEVRSYTMEIDEYSGDKPNDDNPNPNTNEGDSGMDEDEFFEKLEKNDEFREKFEELMSDKSDSNEGGSAVDEEKVNQLKDKRDEFKQERDEYKDEAETLREENEELRDKVLEYKLDSACSELGLPDDKEDEFRDFVRSAVDGFTDEDEVEETIDNAISLIDGVQDQPDTRTYTESNGEAPSTEKSTDEQVEEILNA